MHFRNNYGPLEMIRIERTRLADGPLKVFLTAASSNPKYIPAESDLCLQRKLALLPMTSRMNVWQVETRSHQPRKRALGMRKARTIKKMEFLPFPPSSFRFSVVSQFSVVDAAQQ